VGGLKIEEAAQALIEGSILGSYKFQGYAHKKEKEFNIEKFTLIEADKNKIKGLQKGLRIGETLAWAQNRVRDLVNAPANFTAPHHLAKYAKKVAQKTKKLKCAVYDPRKLGMHALWSIAKGSEEPPRLVVMKYRGSPKEKLTALIGKGVTFDSGGISLKPSRKLWEMKIDMAGAAVVIEAMRAAAELKIKKNLLAVIPLTENMPSGKALKPGDVVSSLSGKSIEVISTDAEGRMILADAITYAQNLKADRILDVATLTGGCITALGDVASGLMGNNEEMIEEVKLAALKSGEKLWRLPLYDEYEDYLKSKLADLKNATEGRGASPSTGGTFLKEFVEEVGWVHIDVAGTAYLSKSRDYFTEGATGIPLRTILEWLMQK
jgi:leucyl aminopeptidase